MGGSRVFVCVSEHRPLPVSVCVCVCVFLCSFDVYAFPGSWCTTLVLRALSVSVYVRVYVSACSLALLPEGYIYHPPNLVLPSESTHTVVARVSPPVLY